MMSLPSAPRAFWLLTRLRLLRLLNVCSAGFSFKKKNQPARRQATAGKRSVGWVLSLLVGAMMLFAMTSMAANAVLNMQCQLDPASTCAALASQSSTQLHELAAKADLLAAPPVPEVFRALMLLVAAVTLVAAIIPLSSKAMSAADWDLEWLVTLPVQRKTLLWARVIERSFANPTGMLAIFPVCTVIAWYSGAKWSAPLLALAPTVVLMMLAAMVVTLCDTGLRLRLPPSQLRNLQGMTSIVSMPLVYFVMSLGMPHAGFSIGVAASAPAMPLWTPLALVIELLTTRDALRAAGCALLLAAEGALLLWLGMQLLQRMLAHGVVASGARESVRKTAAAREAASAGTADGRTFGTPLQRRELRLLARDRNFLAQSLVVPLAVLASQLLLNGNFTDLSQLAANQQMLAIMAFGLGAYVLMLSAFQTINNEGHALWMLYTFPRTLYSMLKEKAQLWTVLAMVYPAAIFAVAIASGATLDAHLASRIVLALAGIPVFAAIAVSLGVWASDPLSPNPQQRIKPTFFYLYTLLTSAYSFALYTEAWNVRLAILVLLPALAFALWQKAHDALPYLLDPAAAPQPRVSLSDGLIAAILFFNVQGLVLFIVTGKGLAAPPLPQVLLAFAIAGAVTYLLARFVFWRTRTTGVPVIRPQRWLPAMGWGLALALPPIAGAVLYTFALRYFEVAIPPNPNSDKLWLVPLAVLAAPLFEEFIFRGLVFNGMRRSMPLLASMAASAAIFAVVHPPLGMLPVFVLGLCTAYAGERSKSLLAPMLTHAVYNGAIVLLS